MKRDCVNCKHYAEDEFGLGVCHRLTINTENGYPSVELQDGTQEPVVISVAGDFACALWEEA